MKKNAVILPTPAEEAKHYRAAHDLVYEAMSELAQARLDSQMARALKALYAIEDMLWQEVNRKGIV